MNGKSRVAIPAIQEAGHASSIIAPDSKATTDDVAKDAVVLEVGPKLPTLREAGSVVEFKESAWIRSPLDAALMTSDAIVMAEPPAVSSIVVYASSRMSTPLVPGFCARVMESITTTPCLV